MAGRGADIFALRSGVAYTPHSTAGLINACITRDGSVVTRLFDDETPPH